MNKCNNCGTLCVDTGTLKIVHGNKERVVACFCAQCQEADRLTLELVKTPDGLQFDSYQPRQSNFGK